MVSQPRFSEHDRVQVEVHFSPEVTELLESVVRLLSRIEVSDVPVHLVLNPEAPETNK
jgi:hypothetical protein